jgi:hypothetical protein
MKGYKLTQEQADELQGELYAPDSYFNPTKDKDGNYFIFNEVEQCTNEQFMWVKDLELVQFWSVLYSPPPLTPFACEIPLELQMPFRGGFFRLNGFEVPLETIQNKKVVNIAYFNWQEFRNELDRKDGAGKFVHQAIKDALMDLWDFVEAHAASIGPWMQDPQNNQLSEFIIIIQ